MTVALRVGLIGCGAIGAKRAACLAPGELLACTDAVPSRAEALCADHPGASTEANWQALLAREDVDTVFIATPHDGLALIAEAAIRAGKHVLVEKPAARTASELRTLLELARSQGIVAQVGFNHRSHRAFRQARSLVDEGRLGALMFVRARYGHGGRPGYDREWRASWARSGGGELIDQGVHLVDLARWFLGDFPHVEGFAHTYFWDMPVDDNAFLTLRTSEGKAAFLHASCTEWKNTFSFELYGRLGKLHVEGLGGSYGVERLSWYHLRPEMGPPDTTIWEYPMADDSWAWEVEGLRAAIGRGGPAGCGLEDALAALEVVEAVYRRSRLPGWDPGQPSAGPGGGGSSSSG